MHAVVIVTDDPDVRLRPADPADVAFARQLFAATRADVFVPAGLDQPMRDRLLAQQFRLQSDGHHRQFPGARTYIIARRNRPVGRLVLHDAELNWHIVDLALLPSCCGQGMGAAIVMGIEAAARMQGIERLTLTVLTGNLGARRFYARLGFTEAGFVAGGAYLNAIKALER
jgi:RimJ/RimL family protein N-acetyltransferase